MKLLHRIVAGLLLVFLPSTSHAQDAPAFKPEELDQLVAPIALHPDQLVAQILMASTYPLEVVQAARFVKDKPGLKGQQLDDALKQYTWDDSVKSLVYFPQVLSMMDDKLDWLQKLGDAFLAQQQDVMAAVQRLRARAQAEGQLKSTPEQAVTSAPAAAAAPTTAPPAQTTVEVVQAPPQVITIQPTNPQVVYVPSYDPMVVYGAWPPAYPPYYPYPVGYFAAGAFTFAAGAAVGAALWGDCNWGGNEININNERVNNFTRNVNNSAEVNKRVEQYRNSGQAGQNRGQWQHNPEHRKGAQYRDTATQQRYNKSGPANAQAREEFRGRTAQGTGGERAAEARSAAQNARGSAQEARSAGQAGGARDRQSGTQPSASPGDRAAQARSSSGAQGGSGQTRQAGAFEGMGSGRDTQSFSDRGNASRQSLNTSSAGAGRAAGTGGVRAGGGGARGGGRR
jgi:hypothetical protein